MISKKASKRAGIHTHKTYLEATSPSSSEDSHLSWDEYNTKADAALNDVMDARLKGESSEGTPRRIFC